MPNSSKPLHVVVAEDSRIQAKILERRLTDAGYEVRVGANGALALELIRQRKPDIIVSDIEMPEMTGYELCRAVKSDPDLKHIPLILLSTLSAPEDIIKGLDVGADNYVTKPYEAAYLQSRMTSLLDSPIADEADAGPAMEVTLAGHRYTVNPGRQQVLNLLMSTFENAVEKNNELIRVNHELTLAKDQLTQWNADLEALNQRLDHANARMSRDLEAAAKVQQSLLPSASPEIGAVHFAWKFLPCDELAGDFLNFFPLDDRHIAAYVVDVSGHGVASSLLSVTIARLMTAHASSSSLLLQPAQGDRPATVVPPAEVAAELNRRFPMEEQGGLYFTIVYGILDRETGTFRYVSAGHPPPVHVPCAGTPRRVDGGGFAIGWMEELDLEEMSVTLGLGDRIYLYSDGVPEAMDAALDQFGDDRMIEAVVRGQAQTLDDSAALLLEDVASWCRRNGPKDDVSILAMEMGGE